MILRKTFRREIFNILKILGTKNSNEFKLICTN